MNTRAGGVLALVAGVAVFGLAAPAQSQELSEKAVKSFMDYAWSLTPSQFSKPDGKVVTIDKTKKDEVMIPVDVAREIIKVGRLSAHAQVCELRDDQILNHRAMMHKEIEKGTWTPQQEVYISQLHLTTVMLLTGKIRLVEKEGDKEVVVDEKAAPAQTCTEEQRGKVKELIQAYVATTSLAKNAKPMPTGAPTATGSTTPAAKPAASAAAAKPGTTAVPKQ